MRFEVARTGPDLEAAYRLVHEAWAREGLLAPNAAGLHCTFFSALPLTTVLVAKHSDEVIAAATLIKDSPSGLPSDAVFRDHNDGLRAQGGRLLEVTDLAIRPDFRGRNHEIAFFLSKFIVEYAVRFMRGSRLVLTPHPRAYDYYAAYFGMSRLGASRQAPHLNLGWVIHLSMDISTPGLLGLKELYAGREACTNMGAFILHQKGPFAYPSRITHDPQCVMDPVMNPRLLHYLFVHRTGLFSRLTADELQVIRSAWEVYFDLSSIDCFRGPTPWEKLPRGFRYPSEIRAMVANRERPILATIFDLSTDGFFLATTRPLEKGELHEVMFYINGRRYSVLAAAKWQNHGQSIRHPKGYGMKLFIENDTPLREALQELHGPALRDPDLLFVRSAG